MSLTSFANPVMLPWFTEEGEQSPIPCGGAIIHAYPYDGRRNLVELTPIRHDPRFIGALACNAAGLPYTIGASHLDRLIHAANFAAGICCEYCHKRRAAVADVCCAGGVGSLTLAGLWAGIRAEVKYA